MKTDTDDAGEKQSGGGNPDDHAKMDIESKGDKTSEPSGKMRKEEPKESPTEIKGARRPSERIRKAPDRYVCC